LDLRNFANLAKTLVIHLPESSLMPLGLHLQAKRDTFNTLLYNPVLHFTQCISTIILLLRDQ